MTLSISPNYGTEKMDCPGIDDVVDVYEDRVRHWIIGPTKLLANTEHGGPAALCIMLTYFEGAWSYAVAKSSSGRSKEYFKRGFADTFKSPVHPESLLLQLGQLLYEDARCGFFHDGLFRSRVYLAEMNKDIAITLPKRGDVLDIEGEIQSVVIDVKRCVLAVERHFDSIIRSLRDTSNTAQRSKFFTFFKLQCDWEQPGPVVAIREFDT
jgi:hypothetical protein